jgi:HEAT repeat protein
VPFKADPLISNVKVIALLGCLLCPLLSAQPFARPPIHSSPYAWQASEQQALLDSPFARVRAGAAEALGFLRAYTAADALAQALADDSPEVRRQVVMSIGWCGGRKQIPALLVALTDTDWVVRQGAWAALTNLTGMEFAFDALAQQETRNTQIQTWQWWWASVQPGQVPQDVLDLLSDTKRLNQANLALNCPVQASSTYKGPASLLTDGALRGAYWQTKNVPFAQSCTIDLGQERSIGCVVVHQYGRGFCMTDCTLSVSLDGKQFETIQRKKGLTDPRLILAFESRTCRFVRITSHASERSLYPATFFELQVFAGAPPADQGYDPAMLKLIRGVRALGALQGEDAASALVEVIRPYCQASADDPYERFMVQSGIRSLGRIGSAEAGQVLIDLLAQPLWARYAADALGDCPSEQACTALLQAYPLYARDAKRSPPKLLPQDDFPALEPADRMYETPYAIALGLSRMPFDNKDNLTQLRKLVPVLAANLPSDFDGNMLYEPEARQMLTAYLLERAGQRSLVCDAALTALGIGGRTSDAPEFSLLVKLAQAHPGDIPFAAPWLAAFCGPEHRAPLIELLEHDNGWVRINAAKALMFNHDQEALEPIARILSASRPEAEFGFFGDFLFTQAKKQGQDEYEAPPPRWRLAYARAVGRLGGQAYIPLLIRLLQDQRSVVEVQHAAAMALDELGTDAALQALQHAQAFHPFYSVRLTAREALWKRNLLPESAAETNPDITTFQPAPDVQARTDDSFPIVFIKGDNSMPNDFQIDIWRQSYSTTDSGPTYRLGDNLYTLSSMQPDAKVTQLTHFQEGYVADCEVSWDGRKIIFARRGGKTDPWWHLYEIHADGSHLRQLTEGPYHDVGPVYLPDDRILFSTSRIGFRDEYHGYPATGLATMHTDGSHLRCIGFNLGRDNEPSIMQDGRILFSRLELFYSRLKTEITVHAVFPDGSKDVTLYGPERRAFWRQVSVDSKEKWWGEVPSRHRVLRLTQPQDLGNGRIVCATTAGLTVIGPGKLQERVIRARHDMAVTSPFPLDDRRILCAATPRHFDRQQVDLGLYVTDIHTGELQLVYNDPLRADFEARPIRARPRPQRLAEQAPDQAYTGRFFCHSVHTSRDRRVQETGRFVRVIEGLPAMARHHTHRSKLGEAWKNHTGTQGRILGTVPLRADGSFYVEVPADRFLHMQVLDADRRVVGNQQIWMYARPGETRSCVGCHESSDTTAGPQRFARTVRQDPVPCLPTGGEFTYRAKMWNKGHLPDEGEQRTRTVHAVNLIGRY